MAEAPPTPARARRRGRRRPGRWLLVLILAVLIGRGLGLAGNEPKPSGGAKTDAEASAIGAVTAPRDAVPQPTENPPPPMPLAEPGAAAAVAGTGTEPGFDPDRFASMTSSIRYHTDTGQLGAALATMQHLRSLPLDGAQRTALVATAEPLQTALAAACGRVVECLCQGRAIGARAEVTRLFGDGVPLAEPWLDSALLAAGLPGGLLRPLAPGERTLPSARPLARGREVRVSASARNGTVVDGRADQVTVRLETPAGWSFPTVSALDVEPVQPTADEAIEMGLLAVQARASLLARLWLAIARLRCPKGLPARGELLAKALS